MPFLLVRLLRQLRHPLRQSRPRLRKMLYRLVPTHLKVNQLPSLKRLSHHHLKRWWLKKWSQFEETTDPVKRKPNPPLQGVLAISLVHVAPSAIQVTVVALMLDAADCATSPLMKRAAPAWGTLPFVRNVKRWNWPIPLCVNLPCKPMVKPWFIC